MYDWEDISAGKVNRLKDSKASLWALGRLAPWRWPEIISSQFMVFKLHCYVYMNLWWSLHEDQSISNHTKKMHHYHHPQSRSSSSWYDSHAHQNNQRPRVWLSWGRGRSTWTTAQVNRLKDSEASSRPEIPNVCKLFIDSKQSKKTTAMIWSPCCRATTWRTSCPWPWNCWRGGSRLKDRGLLLLHISYLWFVSHLTVRSLGSRLDLVEKAQVGVGATLGLWTSFDATVMKRWKEGKPSFQKSAVFLNIVQKAFDPPPPFIWTFVLFCRGCFFMWWIF